MEKVDIERLIPAFIMKDRNGRALARAMETMLEMFRESIAAGMDAAMNPDRMPEWRLDEVAREENIFWYDFNADISAKREIVKNASRTYAMLGTKAGAQQAARDWCRDARIEEWFEYGGEAAHYRIHTREARATEKAAGMARSVETVKRLSAVLDGVYIQHEPARAQLYAGVAMSSGRRARMTIGAEGLEDALRDCLRDEADGILFDENGSALFE